MATTEIRRPKQQQQQEQPIISVDDDDDDNVEQDNDDDDDIIDEEQLEEYYEMVKQLGTYPDKVKINSLTMVAEDFATNIKGSEALYRIIINRIQQQQQQQNIVVASSAELLPLVYLIDSILKNCKGKYILHVQKDAKHWIPYVYNKLSNTEQKQKLQKVWYTWKDTQLFPENVWNEMGQCFLTTTTTNTTTSNIQNEPDHSTPVAGIARTKDGTLVLPKALREEMQIILNEIQSDVAEIEKVSLERLAQIDPALLRNVQAAAQQAIQHNKTSTTSTATTESNKSSIFTEPRSEATVSRSNAWKGVTVEYSTEFLENLITTATENGRYTQSEALEMTQFLATAAATVSLLQQRLAATSSMTVPKKATTTAFTTTTSTPGIVVDPNLFTNDGIKQKNVALVALLYEVGLPFVSSVDGRRFRTQQELSNHLDALFRRNRLEKNFHTDERGWFSTEVVWTLQAAAEQQADTPIEMDTNEVGNEESLESSTMPADESRDRCVICGIHFKMFFDGDDGMYKYSNCREMEVLNDDDVTLKESEDMLVHVTCWKGLGFPEVLTVDQTLQEARHD